MSSSMNFHTAHGIGMTAVRGEGYLAVHVTVNGDSFDNEHKLTIFATKKAFPRFEHAVNAFNTALLDVLPEGETGPAIETANQEV